MGSRYYITGVQLGILLALADSFKSDYLKSFIDEIQKKQYLCEGEELKKLKQNKEDD